MSGAITAGTLATVAGIGAAGSIGSSLIGAHAAGSAADKQMQAAQQAAQLQQQGSSNALDYQNGIYNQTEQNLNPYINAGGGALNNLSYLLGINPTNSTSMVPGAQPLNLNPSNPQTPQTNAAMPVSRLGSAPSLTGTAQGSSVSPTGSPSMPIGVPRATAVAGIQGGGINQASGAGQAGQPASGGFGSLLQRYAPFQAPDGLTMQNDPGYQERLKLGTDAIQRSAAARGGILTGGTARDLMQFGQDYGSNEYNNVYNRALQSYGTNYGVQNNDSNNIYNRLLGLSNSGQNAANSLGSFGQQSANNVTSNLLGTGQQIGQDYGLGAAANASGIYNQGSALAGGLNGITGNLSQLLMLKQLGLGAPSAGSYQSSLSNLYGAQNQNLGGLYQSPTLSGGIGYDPLQTIGLG